MGPGLLHLDGVHPPGAFLALQVRLLFYQAQHAQDDNITAEPHHPVEGEKEHKHRQPGCFGRGEGWEVHGVQTYFWVFLLSDILCRMGQAGLWTGIAVFSMCHTKIIKPWCLEPCHYITHTYTHTHTRTQNHEGCSIMICHFPIRRLCEGFHLGMGAVCHWM